MGREHDVLVRQALGRAPHHAHDVVRLDLLDIHRHPGANRGGEREVRERLALVGHLQDLSEGVSGAGEEPFGPRRIEGNRDLLAGGVVERGVGQGHRRVQAIWRRALPRHVHGLGIGDGDHADRAQTLQRGPAFRR